MIQTVSNQRLNGVYEDARVKTPLSKSERAVQLAKLALVVIGLGAVIYVAYRCGSNHEKPGIEKLKTDIELLNRQKQELEDQLRLERESAQNTRNCEADISFLNNNCETKISSLKNDCEMSLNSCKSDKTFWHEYYSRRLKQCEERSDRYMNMLLDDLRSNQIATKVKAENSSRIDASMFFELWARFLGIYQ